MFLQHLHRQIDAIEPRVPFHPGALQRFERFADRSAAAGPLPYLLRTDVDLAAQPHLGQEESFAPVLAETAIDADDADEYLDRVGRFVNEHTFGALAAHLLAPVSLLRRHRVAIDALCTQLPHGTIALNTWAAVGYSLMTTPWGSGATARDHSTGRGFVHGTLCLRAPLRSIVTGPRLGWPPPPWHSRRRRVAMSRSMTAVQGGPSPTNLTRFLAAAARP